MANERGHPKLSYEVLKAEFHPQVAEKIGDYVSKGPAPRTLVPIALDNTNIGAYYDNAV